MHDQNHNVKGFGRRVSKTVTDWVDCHPRTGWWIAGFAVLNTILNLLDLFVH